jgi:hypothetical protein
MSALTKPPENAQPQATYTKAATTFRMSEFPSYPVQMVDETIPVVPT